MSAEDPDAAVGLADTASPAPPEGKVSSASDPLADTAADLGDSPSPTGDALEHAAIKAGLRAKMFGASRADEAPRIGRYAILKVLGEGGMGTVYAGFDDQLDRRVAIKLVKGAGSEDARKRMLREAQAMAKLSHPNVVPVFEVGEHDAQLFVAMEYVRGATLKDWCEAEVRGWPDVIDKYLQAGRGLAAAHAEGLVHRDFKPRNAIVGSDGRVRVLDFGLAAKHGEASVEARDSSVVVRAKGAALDAPMTATGAVLGTPAYMPPEQFMSGTVDARSDQFSFCVALWEGLYGARPFEGATVAALFTRIAQEKFTEPAKSEVPVAVRSALVRGLKSTADERWPDLAALLAELEGVVVARARTSRSRRVIGGVVVGGLAIGGTMLGRDQIEAYRTRRCHREGADEAAAIWNDDGRARVRQGLVATGLDPAAATADKTLPWLDAYASAWQATRTEICIDAQVRHRWTDEDLDRASWCLQQRSMALAALVEQLGEADRTAMHNAVTAAAALPAVDTCRDAAVLRRMPRPPADAGREVVANTRRLLAKAKALGDAGRIAEESTVAEEALDRARALDDRALLAEALLAEGAALEDDGKYEAAATMLEDAYFEALAIDDHETAASAGRGLVRVEGTALQRHREGLRWARLADASLDKLGKGQAHPDRADGLDVAGTVHVGAGQYADAESVLTRALVIREQALGPDHPAVAKTLTNLSMVHFANGAYAQAKVAGARALAIREQALGADHPDVADSLLTLANPIALTGDHAQAKPMYQRALAIWEAALGPDHPTIAGPVNNLAVLHHDAGELAEAEAKFSRALAIQEKALGPNHPDVARSLNNLGALHESMGQHARAKAEHERALAIHDAALSPDHPDTAESLKNLAGLEEAAGELARASVLYDRALAIFDAHEGVQQGELEARFDAARLIVSTHGDRQRAVALAETAAAGHRDAGVGKEAQLAEIEAWLAAHREP